MRINIFCLAIVLLILCLPSNSCSSRKKPNKPGKKAGILDFGKYFFKLFRGPKKPNRGSNLHLNSKFNKVLSKKFQNAKTKAQVFKEVQKPTTESARNFDILKRASSLTNLATSKVNRDIQNAF